MTLLTFLYNRNENLLTLYLEIRSFGKIVLYSLTTHMLVSYTKR